MQAYVLDCRQSSRWAWSVPIFPMPQALLIMTKMPRLACMIAVLVLLTGSGCTVSDLSNFFANSATNSDQYKMSRMNKDNTWAVPPDCGP